MEIFQLTSLVILFAFVFWPGLFGIKKNQKRQYYFSEAKKRAYAVALRSFLTPIYLSTLTILSLFDFGYIEILVLSFGLFVIAAGGTYYNMVVNYWWYGKKDTNNDVD